MKLSTRTRYAMRALIELAENGGRSPLQLKIIAKRQDISIKYLEQLMAVLKSAGLVRSIRGSKGGYILTRGPEQIKLSEAFHCLEGTVTTVECVGNEDYCNRTADCATRRVWMQVQMAMDDVLKSITLRDMVKMSEGNRKLNYQI
ncbi:MAG: Rrf2 family transcriptional regulator [Phycisphaerales bacterium]|jgi:Rrf2 family protein